MNSTKKVVALLMVDTDDGALTHTRQQRYTLEGSSIFS